MVELLLMLLFFVICVIFNSDTKQKFQAINLKYSFILPSVFDYSQIFLWNSPFSALVISHTFPVAQVVLNDSVVQCFW